ncbi:MAG TPA: sugar transferase [Solirubrobacterales bacterium]|nr:sugar transferase [Solirubrobacterales bacterium]
MSSPTAAHASGNAEVAASSVEPQRESRAKQRGSVLARMLVFGDSLAAAVSAALAILIVGFDNWDGLIFVAGTVLLWPASAFSIGLYRGDQLSIWASAVPEVPRGFVAILLITWPLFGIAAATSIHDPVVLTFLTVIGLAAFGGVARTVVRAGLHRNEGLRQRTLILGSGLVAGQVVEKIGNNAQYGLLPIGIVDDDVYNVGSPDLPWLGRFADLKEIIEKQQADRVIIAFSRASHEELLECIRACRDAGVAVDVVPRLFEFLDGVRALDQVGGLPLLSIGTPTLTSVSMAAKRALDVAGSLALLLAFSPLMLAIAIAIKVESRGPIFFRQPRAGRSRSSFRLIKFRSMYTDAEERKADLSEMNEADDGVMFKIREDPRVTKVGRFIRRYSLDELPQLFNVLVGEMSLVGPRPLIFPETDALEQEWHLRRLELRPGLTGPWQVYGRSQSPFQEMVRFDYQYVAGWSLARDIEILLATIPAVLSGRGAY